MLKHIEEFGKYVAITGFRNAKIKDIEGFLKKIGKEKQPSIEIQFFDAQLVATWQHLYFAALNALTAFANGDNISKSLAMETMLYASAQRQIRKATELVGIKHDSSNIATLVIDEKPETAESALSMISKHLGAKRDDNVLGLSEEKMATIQKKFGISDLELETVTKKDSLEKALTNLVIEHMALLAIQR